MDYIIFTIRILSIAISRLKTYYYSLTPKRISLMDISRRYVTWAFAERMMITSTLSVEPLLIWLLRSSGKVYTAIKWTSGQWESSCTRCSLVISLSKVFIILSRHEYGV